jgi:hypothetical protein
MTEAVAKDSKPIENSVANFVNIGTEMDCLFVLYSRLLGSMHERAVKDYIRNKIKYHKLRVIVYLITMTWFHERIIVGVVTFNRKLAIRRIRNFLDVVNILFEDMERSETANQSEIKQLHAKAVKYQEKIPQRPTGITIFQAAPIVSAAVAVILLGFNLSGGNLEGSNAVTFLLYGLVGGVLLLSWFLTSVLVFVRQFTWYLFVSYILHLHDQELVVLRELRPLVREFDRSLFKKEDPKQ